jgi:hypothetical protein
MNRQSRSTGVRSLPSLTSLAIGLLVAAACGAPGATPAPSPSPSPTPGPQTNVGSAAQAAALLFASDERFARMQPLRTDVIGQSAWYEAFEEGDHYNVTITIGAGDCMAGCIQHHTYSYTITHEGQIALVIDEGDDVPIPPATGGGASISLRVSLSSGPSCPVLTNPPDPGCAARPVVNAEVVVFDVHGRQVASATSAEDGTVSLELPGGAYYVAAQEVEGFMGQAGPQAFSAVGGDAVDLLFDYDTGIR